jgi:hypothetical protein
MHGSDCFAAQSQEEYDVRAGEGPIDTDAYNGDGQSVSSSSDAGGSDEVSSVIDLEILDLQLQYSLSKRKFYFIRYKL